MVEQRSDEWHSLRLGQFTASRAADLMNVLKSGKPGVRREELIAQLVAERLSGAPFETADSYAMRRGRELEDEALGEYIITTGANVVEQAYVKAEDLPNTGCSPDGLVGGDGLVEVKCPLNASKHLNALRFGSHADKYNWQVQHQMMVTGREWCDVVSYHPQFPPELRLAIKRVERSAEDIIALRTQIALADAEIEQIVSQVRIAA